MSIIPLLGDAFLRPSRRPQQLAIWQDPDEYLEAYLPREILRYPLEELANLRSVLQDTGSSVSLDKDKFQANFDVQQFKPEEISVKVTGDRTVTIEGKHEEKPDEHGYISRHFVRKYVLPEDCDAKNVQSKLSSDGVLTVTAPKINEGKKIEYREIPITRTGQPMKRVEQKEGSSQEEAKKTKKGSAKKAKFNNAKSPQQGFSPKQNKNQQNGPQKFNKKNKRNSESENNSEKLKAFAGTQAVKENVEKKKKEFKKSEDATGEKKRRRDLIQTLKVKLQSNKAETMASIESKIKDIENRPALTKTARKKLKQLIRLKRIAMGEPSAPQPQKTAASKIQSKKQKKGNQQQVVQKKGVQLNQAKTNGKPNKNQKAQNKLATKKQIGESDDEDESDDSDLELNLGGNAEEESSDEQDEVEAEASSDEDEEAAGDEEDDESGDEEEDDEAEEEESEEDDDSEEDSPPPPKMNKDRPKSQKVGKELPLDLNQLKKSNLIAQKQKRYVLFVGNIPYDTNRQDIIEHFKKSGEIKDVRIQTEKKTSRPRGFAYVELANEESYQKCLSMHHTFLKDRRINVLYTQGGKKKGVDKKKEIKVKNMKLHAMRKQGKLAGSKKESQKRSFRRAKKAAKGGEQED
ncbi:hypothetical protein NQ315_007080 [Exocentrus adspersus]|uniref:Uncharacterized protein n=1 Tax=Exocentrus adspersus TaxID=1586481 RepID=A0AAV8WCF1_9CUCU|nr:hypothetical protein NQ315_007080 [Exocentrus adspersus]